jgi:predicted ATPase
MFTDIERSTELWESAPESMRISLERHNQIIDLAIIQEGGKLFKRIGDATCSTFDSPAKAAHAARTGQIEMAVEHWPPDAPIRVRWAIHEGPCLEEGDDYLGLTLTYVARILNLAHPSQILLSEEAALSLNAESKTWLGMRILKGIANPVGICQLLDPELPKDFPQLPGEKLGESNLPLLWNQFIGRGQEIESLRAILTAKRLVTIIGSGGAGKTRSAIEVAQKSLGNFRHGIWLTSLAPLDRSDLVRGEIAKAVNHPKPAEATDESLLELLRGRNLLLILDNCEHLVAESARLASLILSNCPDVTILATSRSPLQIPGEARFPLESLSLPTDSGLDSLAASEAVGLFLDRAQEVQPSFSLTASNADAVYSLIFRVDGIPLALELAAAQLASYSVEDVDRLIAERALKLRTEDPTALPHRQTTDTTIDWSYRLLNPDEQWLCRRISVFAGGANRESIEAVARTGTTTSLQKLVNSSLVKFDPSTQRYSLLELVREFMIDRLIEADELAEARDRHLDWVVDLAQEARPHLDGSDQAKWLDRLDLEHLNVRTALTWSTNREQRLRAAVSLHWFWVLRGHVREGQAWLAGSLSGFTPENPSLHAQAENALGVLYWVQGDYFGAKIHLEKANELSKDSGDLKTSSGALANLAMVRAQSGDFDGAESDFLEAFEGFRQLGDLTKQAHILNNIGVVYSMKGEPEHEARYLMQGVNLYEQLGDQINVGMSLTNVASSLRKIGRLDEAIGKAKAAGRILLNLKEYGAVGYSLVQLALVEFQLDNWEIAAQLQGKATALINTAGYHISPDTTATWNESCHLTKGRLGVKSYETAFERGIQQSIEAFIGDRKT